MLNKEEVIQEYQCSKCYKGCFIMESVREKPDTLQEIQIENEDARNSASTSQSRNMSTKKPDDIVKVDDVDVLASSTSDESDVEMAAVLAAPPLSARKTVPLGAKYRKKYMDRKRYKHRKGMRYPFLAHKGVQSRRSMKHKVNVWGKQFRQWIKHEKDLETELEQLQNNDQTAVQRKEQLERKLWTTQDKIHGRLYELIAYGTEFEQNMSTTDEDTSQDEEKDPGQEFVQATMKGLTLIEQCTRLENMLDIEITNRKTATEVLTDELANMKRLESSMHTELNKKIREIERLDEERKLEREVIQLTKTRWDSRKERLESELERKNEELTLLQEDKLKEMSLPKNHNRSHRFLTDYYETRLRNVKEKQEKEIKLMVQEQVAYEEQIQKMTEALPFLGEIMANEPVGNDPDSTDNEDAVEADGNTVESEENEEGDSETETCDKDA